MEKLSRYRGEKGQSLVELALIIVLVLVLLAGVVDLGRMMYEYLTMRDAAQEGAGYASIYPNYCLETTNRVMQNLPDSNYAVLVFVDPPSTCGEAAAADNPTITHGCSGNEVVVTIDHSFSVTMPILSLFTGPTVPMHVEIRDNIVRPKCSVVPSSP